MGVLPSCPGPAREHGCSLSHGLPQSFLPSPQGPIPHPRSMTHALSLSGRRAHLPDTHTCTHCLPHHNVCVWALGCHGFTSRQPAGFCLPRRMGSEGVGESDPPVPHRLPGPAHPHPCPPAMPASRTPRAEGLDPAKDRTWGCILGLDSATPTCNRDAAGLALARSQSLALRKNSQV